MASGGRTGPGAGTGRHRQNHRHGRAVACVALLGGNIIGLAPTATAAIELGEDLSATTDTIAKYVATAARGPGAVPAWFRHIDPDTLIIIDEAGKAGTLDLDAVITHALARGASIRLVGDDCQLGSISAGGVMRDIARDHRRPDPLRAGALPLTAESAATLAIRAGDPAGLGFYIDHHRVHVGSDDTAADMAYTAWRPTSTRARQHPAGPHQRHRRCPQRPRPPRPPRRRRPTCTATKSCCPTAWPPPPAT